MIRTITQMTNGAITAGVDLHGLAGAQKAVSELVDLVFYARSFKNIILSVIENIFVTLYLIFQANIVHGNVTNVDIENHLARGGAQGMDIVVTLLIIKRMERTAQDVLKVLYLNNFELAMLHKVLVVVIIRLAYTLA